MPHFARTRSLALIMIGNFSVLLLMAFAASANAPVVTAPLTLAVLGSLVGIWLAAHAPSTKSVWARGCLVNGMLSAVVGVSFQVQDEPWSGRPGYPDDLERAIGSLTNYLWAFATRIGLIAFALAAILFAISYWLFRPPRREA